MSASRERSPGSPVAEKVSQSTLELLRHWPKADCSKGDRGAMESLLPEVREAWLEANPLPGDLPFYSLATCPEPDRVSKVFKSSYKKMAKTDARNDGMVLVVDQFIPDSSFLGCVNADHWAVAVPIARTRPKAADRYVEHNDYPREALFEAILRFVEEDLGRRARPGFVQKLNCKLCQLSQPHYGNCWRLEPPLGRAHLDFVADARSPGRIRSAAETPVQTPKAPLDRQIDRKLKLDSRQIS